MAGFIPNVIPHQPILSAWGNAIRDRTVMDFANAAERASQWVAPPEGAMSYLRDVDRVETFNGTIWVPIAARGIMSYVENTGLSNVGTTPVDIPGLTISGLAVVANRRIRVVADVSYQSGTNAVARASLQITDAANAAFIERWDGIGPGGELTTMRAERILTPAAGSYAFKARAVTQGQTINVMAGANLYGFMYVEDVGGV